MIPLPALETRQAPSGETQRGGLDGTSPVAVASPNGKLERKAGAGVLTREITGSIESTRYNDPPERSKRISRAI
jgi:hypothetical protein